MILEVGDPQLKRTDAEVIDFRCPNFKADLQKMLSALKKFGGMGLAAPQLGIDRRILLIESKPNNRYPHAPRIELMTVVNPSILTVSDDEELGWEGCLSVPGKRVMVSRPYSVKISYQDEEGEGRVTSLNGFGARIFFHEYDHLEGLSILDRATGGGDIISEEEYFRN